MMKTLMFFTAFWAMLLVLSGSVVHGQDPADLEEYLTEIREAGMTEEAHNRLTMLASIMLGHTVLDFRKDDSSARVWTGYVTGTCPNPKADLSEEALRQRRQAAEREALVSQLKPFADSDSSGFVSTREGSLFRGLVEFGYLAAHVVNTDGATLKLLAEATGLSDGDVEQKLSAYRELADRMAAASIKPLPKVGVE